MSAALGWGAPGAAASVIQVTTSNDDPVASGCSLRDAITSANTDSAVGDCTAGSGVDTIAVPAGTYKLTHTGASESGNATGDLNILKQLTISGAGADSTIIDGNGTDRVMNFSVNAFNSLVEGVTITDGHTLDGAAAGGTATSADTNTTATGVAGGSGGNGGGILTQGNLTLKDCVIRNNVTGSGGAGQAAAGDTGPATGGTGGGAAGGPGGNGGSGGGIYAHQANVTITNCQITNNSTGGGGPGGPGTGGPGGVASSGAGENGGFGVGGNGGNGGSGGGIFVDHNLSNGKTLAITSSVIDSNRTGNGGNPGVGTAGNGSSASGPGPATGGSAGGVNSQGLAFSGGGGGSGGPGGAIETSVATTVTDSDVSDNIAGNGAAGVAAHGASGGNGVGSAGPDGGGGGFGFVVGGPGGAGGSGGGVFSNNGTLALTRVGLTGNHTGSAGAGGSAQGGTRGSGGTGVYFDGTIGGTGGAGGSGGGLGTAGSQVRTLSDVTVDSNVAGSGGAGNSAVDSYNGSFGGNGGAAGNGGGLDNEAGTITIARSTISANKLGTPGAPGSGQSTFQPTPQAGAAPTGGALDAGTSSAIGGSIVSANAEPQCAGPLGDSGNNIANPAAPGCLGKVVDPLLGPLVNHGGLSPTRAIPATSPALDAYACTGLDQRGATRPAGSGCDIGAYELAPPVVSGQSVDNGDVQVVLKATVIPNVNATAVFQYGSSASYGSTTPVQTIAGSGPQTVSATVTGLSRKTTYHFRVRVTNSVGTVTGTDQTFTTLSAPPTSGNPGGTGNKGTSVLLGLSKLTVRPNTFAVAAAHAKSRTIPLGTIVNYKLTQRATVQLSFARQIKGAFVKRHNKRVCIAKHRAGPGHARCVVYSAAGSMRHTSAAGTTNLPFSGLLGRHALAPGRYRLTAVASTGPRARSRAVTTLFTVVALPRRHRG